MDKDNMSITEKMFGYKKVYITPLPFFVGLVLLLIPLESINIITQKGDYNYVVPVILMTVLFTFAGIAFITRSFQTIDEIKQKEATE